LNNALIVSAISFVSGFCSYPFDYGHAKLASDVTKNRKYSNVWDVFSEAPKKLKLRCAFQGFQFQLLTSLFYTGCIALYGEMDKEHKKSPLESSIRLAVMIGLAETFCYPIDTWKRVYQVSHMPNFLKAYNVYRNCTEKFLHANRLPSFTEFLMNGFPAHLIKICIMMASISSISGLLKGINLHKI